MIGSANGRRIGITGLGVNVPERVLHQCRPRAVRRHDRRVDRRAHGHPRAALRDPGAGAHRHRRPGRRDRARRGRRGPGVDRPDHRGHGHPGHDVPDQLGAARRLAGDADAAAYDLLAGCTGFMYALAQAYAMVAAGSLEARARRRRRRALEDPRLGGPLDARPLRRRSGCRRARARRRRGRLSRLRLGADGGGGKNLWLPGSGSRHFEDADKLVKMNGREVFKFATRVMVSSARKVLDECGTDRRRRRRLRAAPGEQADHRLRRGQARSPRRRSS